MNWIDIDMPAQGYHFKDLNMNGDDAPKFVNLNSESSETVETSTARVDMLASSVYDLVSMKTKTMVMESRLSKNATPDQNSGDEGDTENLYSTDAWSEFEDQAKVILTLLKAKEDETNQTISKLRKLFQNLGEGDASKGLGFFKQLDKYLVECGGDNTQPKLKASLLLNEWNSDEIRSLLDLFNQVRKQSGKLLTALQRVIHMKNKTTTMRQLINLAYGNGGIDIDDHIITKLTRFNRIRKKTAVGQGEVLFAILFKDCRLGSAGDIDCYKSGSVGVGDVIPVEMKANSAGPDDIGRRPVELMMKTCGYHQRREKKKTHAYNAYQKDEEEVFWVRNDDNMPELDKKERKAGSIPTIDLSKLSKTYKNKAFAMMEQVWDAYIKKVNGHGSSQAYILYIRPGTESQKINGWMDNNLIVIRSVDDIKNAFNNGLISIKAQTIQGNEFMTFKLQVENNKAVEE